MLSFRCLEKVNFDMGLGTISLRLNFLSIKYLEKMNYCIPTPFGIGQAAGVIVWGEEGCAMYFPPVPKCLLEEALSFALSVKCPGTQAELLPEPGGEPPPSAAAGTGERTSGTGKS